MTSDGSVEYTARCPACGRDATWTDRRLVVHTRSPFYGLSIQSEHTDTQIDCECGYELQTAA